MIRHTSWSDRFSEFTSSNLGVKVVSVAIAVLLWGIVLGSRNVEVTKEVPLEVVTPVDIVPANEIPEKIVFRLSGPKAFLRSILDRREEPIRVNLAGAKPALVTYRFFSDNIRVPIGVRVLSINPTAILIKLEYLKRKDVPVRMELRGVPPEGFHVVKAELHPETIRIKGPESRVDSVSEISTAPVDISGLTSNLEQEVSLDFARHNVQLDSPLPKMLLTVGSASPNFRIKNVDIRVGSSYKVRLDEKNVTVLVRASPHDLQNLDQREVFGSIDLKGKPKGHYVEKVNVVLPRNIGLVKVIPENVGVTLY